VQIHWRGFGSHHAATYRPRRHQAEPIITPLTHTDYRVGQVPGMKYLPLAIEITQNGGHHYHQVWRDEHAAVYEQKGALRTVIGYEAITIKKRPEEMKFGKLCPAREIYPCSEDWGTIAVTRRDLESAIEAAKGFSKRASARCRGKYVDDNTAGALAVLARM